MLIGGARTNLTGLTASEARALFLTIGAGASPDPAVRSALQKLLQALPETFRADAQAAAEAVVIDPAAWGEGSRERVPSIEVLEDALVGRRKVALEYEGRGHRRSRRLVDPWGLVDKDGVWYLVAGTAKGRRTFRTDRIIAATMTDQAADRPADLELSREWEQVVSQVEQRRSAVSATVLVPARLLPVVRGQFGRHCDVLETLSDGRLRVQLRAHMALSIAERLAGWGTTIEVIESDAVRTELARLGGELVARYASG